MEDVQLSDVSGSDGKMPSDKLYPNLEADNSHVDTGEGSLVQHRKLRFASLF